MILKSTSSEAYTNLKLAEQLRKQINSLKKTREEKALTNQSPSHTSSLGSSSNFKCKCTRNRTNRVETEGKEVKLFKISLRHLTFA